MSKKITFFLILFLCIVFKGYCIKNILNSDVNGDLTKLTEGTYLNDGLNSSFSFAAPTITAKIRHVTCLVDGVPSNDGAIDITADGYSGVVTYEWSTTDGSGLDATAQGQTGLSAGTYYLTVYHNSKVCYNRVYVVKNPTQLDFETIITHNVCYGELNGSIIINASGGGGSYEYSINNGESFVNNNTFTELPAGNYTVVVKDCDGCEVKKIVRIEEGSELSISCPDDLTLESCISQTEIDNSFSNWISQFTFEGGVNAVENGLENCTVPDVCGGEVVVNYSVTDDCGATESCSATFSVEVPGDLIFENEAEDLAVECGRDNTDDEFLNWLNNNGNASVSGSCDVTWSNNYSDSNWETTCGNIKEITVTFTATDTCNNSIETTATFIYTDTTAPVFSETVPGNITTNCTSIPDAVNLTATDNCDNDVEVIFTEINSGQNDGCGSEYIITRIWTATDCAGNSVSQTQIIHVEDSTAPVFSETLPTDITLDCTSEIPSPVILTATDNCDNDVEVIFNETTSGQNTCGSEFIITRTWTATDCGGNSVSHTQTINVQDTTAPVFSRKLPARIIANCASVPNPVNLTATDNCENNVEVVFIETTSGNGSCGSKYTISRTWTAQDCAGNTVSQTQTIIVEDTTAPVFTGVLPTNVTLGCEEDLSDIPVLTATDDCDNDVDIVFHEEIPNYDPCVPEYTILRTWTATDCAGHFTEYTQEITIVNDTTFPELITPLPAVINANCSNVPDAPQLEFEDGCFNGEIDIEFSETTQPNGNNRIQIIRTWIATTLCGDQAEFNQTVNVNISYNTIAPAELCIDDNPVNLDNYLPTGIPRNGTWEAVSSNSNLQNGMFDPSVVPLGIHTFIYTTTTGNCPAKYELKINVHNDCVVSTCSSEDQVHISAAITPNGDPYNEYFEVTGVEECGFIIEVQIFNRWGNLVYESNNYQNNWNGFSSNVAVGSNGKVPSGTYYYIVNLKNSGFPVFRASLLIAGT